MKQIVENIKYGLAAFCILLGIIAMTVLDYTAFKQQYPQATIFTYIMRGDR
jgi:hypothetical protein